MKVGKRVWRLIGGMVAAVLVVAYAALSEAQDLKGYQDAYEKSLETFAAERQAASRALTDMYQAALEALRQRAQNAGNLDLVLTVNEELARINKGERPAPKDALDERYAELKGLWAKYEAGRRTRDRAVARKIDELTQKYDKELERTVSDLTRQGRIDAAMETKVARTALNSRKAVTWARRVLAEPVTVSPARESVANGGPAKKKGDLYLIVDLSGGLAAKAYPVTYLADVPAGGWSDAYKTDQLVLRKIEPGTFMMGSPADELGRREDETRHKVTLTKPFYIGVFEVTQRQWELVMGDRPSLFTKDYASRPVEQVAYASVRRSPSGPGWPVSVDVEEGTFMGQLRAKTELKGFDLPTEAQWEYACRAGTGTALCCGKNLSGPDKCPNLDEIARYDKGWALGSGADPAESGTARVGSYRPNAWGLYDMHGNVLEWCLDWYGDYEAGATDPAGPERGGEGRVLRGGSWWRYSSGSAANCRSARRYFKNPHDGGKQHGWGFRAAMAVAQAEVTSQ